MKEIFYDFYGYNTIIFYYLNHLSNYSYFSEALKIISALFQIENFAIYYFILCFYQYYKLRTIPESSFAKQFHSRYNKLVYIGTCYACFGFTYALLKFSINLPRPFCSLADGSFITTLPTIHERCLSSFPSAHTGLALMVTILCWRYFNIWMRGVSVILVMLVALSRIALSMHYPADILYSFIVIIFVMTLAQWLFRFLQGNVIRYFEGKVKEWLF